MAHWWEQSQTPRWVYPGLVRGRACTVIAIVCALFGRLKDVSGCSAAPEDFSSAAFLALFLFRVSQRACVCARACVWMCVCVDEVSAVMCSLMERNDLGEHWLP